jgi:hypothetical protein
MVMLVSVEALIEIAKFGRGLAAPDNAPIN